MHGLQACFFKYITVVAFHIYPLRGEDATKREVGGCALNSHGNYIIDHGKIMEKSWNCVFEFLWEPCPISQTKSYIDSLSHTQCFINSNKSCYIAGDGWILHSKWY